MIDVGKAEGEPATDDGGRDERDTRLLKAQKEFMVQGVKIRARSGVAEADNVQRRGGEKLEVGVREDGGGEPARILDVLADDPGEVFGAEGAQGDPDFERVEAAREVDAAVGERDAAGEGTPRIGRHVGGG